MINTHLGEILSFGVLSDLGGEQEMDLEFTSQLKVRVKQGLFFNVGADIGRVPELRGGFEIGTTKIQELDSGPTQKS